MGNETFYWHGLRESGFRNRGNVFLCDLESWALESGIQRKESGITTRDWNPESKFHRKRLESSTWNPESKTLLDYLTRGDKEPFGEGITLN